MALEGGAAASTEEQVASRAPGQAHFTGLQELVALKQYGKINLGSYCSFFGHFLLSLLPIYAGSMFCASHKAGSSTFPTFVPVFNGQKGFEGKEKPKSNVENKS